MVWRGSLTLAFPGVGELDAAATPGVLKEMEGRRGHLADPAAVSVVAVGLVLRGDSGRRVDVVVSALA